MNRLAELPELNFEIFKYLSIKEAPNYLCVNHTWNNQFKSSLVYQIFSLFFSDYPNTQTPFISSPYFYELFEQELYALSWLANRYRADHLYLYLFKNFPQDAFATKILKQLFLVLHWKPPSFDISFQNPLLRSLILDDYCFIVTNPNTTEEKVSSFATQVNATILSKWFSKEVISNWSQTMTVPSIQIAHQIHNCNALYRTSEHKEVVFAAMNRNNYPCVMNEKFVEDVDIVTAICQHSPSNFSTLPAKWRDNKSLVICLLLRGCNSILQYASDRLKEDRDVALAVLKGGWNGQDFQYLHERIQQDKSIALPFLQKAPELYPMLKEPIRSDRDIILTALTGDGMLLKYMNADIRNTRGLVSLAVSKLGLALEYASAALQDDKNLVTQAIMAHGMAYIFASSTLRQEKEIVHLAVRKYGFVLQRTSNVWRDDKETVLLAIRSMPEAIQYASDRLRNDKEVAFECLAQRGRMYEYLGESIKNDREICMAALERNYYSFVPTISSVLRNDKELMSMAIYHDPTLLACAGIAVRNDKEIVLTAINKNATTMVHVSDQLKDDIDVLKVALGKELKHVNLANCATAEQIALKVLSKYGYFFKYFSSRIQLNIRFMSVIVKQNVNIGQYFTYYLQTDKNYILELSKIAPKIIQYADDSIQKDRSFLLQMAKQECLHLKFLKFEQFKNDRELVSEVVTHLGYQIAHASETLQKDNEMVWKAVRSKYPPSPRVLLSKFQNDKEIIMEIMQRSGRLLEHVNENLKDDKEVVMCAVEQSHSAYCYASKRMQQDEDVLELLAAKRSTDALC